jgi:hypothetical protein
MNKSLDALERPAVCDVRHTARMIPRAITGHLPLAMFILLVLPAVLQAQESIPPLRNLPLQVTSGSGPGLFDGNAQGTRLMTSASGWERGDDSILYNMYGDLMDDNPAYNAYSPWWKVVLEVTATNAFVWALDRYIFHYEFSYISLDTWKYNLQTGWEWDIDRFGMNNFMHPFLGNMYFNSGRSNGHTYYESAAFAMLGSVEWEYFGETTQPSYNDLINTTVNGSFIGEIFYRFGSNILDDRTSGSERFFRELAAGILTPTRFLSRLTNGYLARSTNERVYQKEPLNTTLSSGYHRVNKGETSEDGSNSVFFNAHFDYGNPFEMRRRKPFDYFKLRTDIDIGVGRKILDNFTGYGILFGTNYQPGRTDMLFGVFQHMNYFDNKTFELATIAFGPGLVTKVPVSTNSNLYTNVHAAIVPFSSLSNRFGPDTTQVRDYNYGGGAEIKLESTYNISGAVSLTFIGYAWWLHTFVGVPGESFVALIKPRIDIRVFNNVNIGYEQMLYISSRYPTDYPAVSTNSAEEKVYLEIYLEQFKFEH